jgi:hypothetical protein
MERPFMPNPLIDVPALTERQRRAVTEWHALADPIPESVLEGAGISREILKNHFHNYRLWHHEDQARRTDAGDAVIAGVKRAIDKENQARNDAIERIDDALAAQMELRGAKPEAGARMNSETPGAIIDTLSILSLKVHHMAEQSRRADADAAHRTRCAEKAAVLERQRGDLAECLDRLLDQLAEGRMRLARYRQFKMYNDPSLNPAVYGKK